MLKKNNLRWILLNVDIELVLLFASLHCSLRCCWGISVAQQVCTALSFKKQQLSWCGFVLKWFFTLLAVLTCDYLDDDDVVKLLFKKKMVLILISFRALLLGLACNHNLKEVSLDLSSCEVRIIHQDVFKRCNDGELELSCNPLG